MSASRYKQFVTRWRETMEPPPQSFGRLTGTYKRVTHQLKTMPIPSLVMISILLVGILIIWLGPSVATLVSLLQKGF